MKSTQSSIKTIRSMLTIMEFIFLETLKSNKGVVSTFFLPILHCDKIIWL